MVLMSPTVGWLVNDRKLLLVGGWFINHSKYGYIWIYHL